MSNENGGNADEYVYIADKQERKKLRKKRIEKRSLNEQGKPFEILEETESQGRTGAKQVAESFNHLDKRKHKGLQDVTSIRVAADEIEANRRIEDEELRRDRLSKLQQEAFSSAKANAAVEMKWAELLDKDIPQELYLDIQRQMAACNSVMKSKDDLITEFQRQLRSKDEEYVRTLRQQAEDVEEVMNRIRREFRELNNEYEKELTKIDEAFTEERERIIQDNTSDIENLFEQRKNREVFYKESKQKREEQYQKEIDDLIAKGADNYNKLKIELELNIQTLKQQLEEIRATYQLNTEKLDYNYRVLTELDVEKHTELSRYKRRQTRLKDQLNQLTSKYAEIEAADTKLNNELTEDYRNLTQKYKDLQSKFRHFEIADTGKYEEVWAMHEDVVNDLLDQLLKADKIITEQQLGWKWQAPDMNALHTILGKYSHIGLPGGIAESNTPATGTDKQLTSKKIPGARVRAVLKVLATEAGFLVNSEVRESLESLPDDETDISKAEAMLRALGVKSEERLKVLVSYFFRDTAPGADSYLNESMDHDETELLLYNAPEDVIELKEMIQAENVIAAVKTYMEDMTVDGPVRTNIGGSTKATDDDIRIGQKRLNNMKSYWNQLSQVVPDDSTDVWKQLEKDYGSVREMLHKRAQSLQEVDALNEKNVELKRLLNQYLGDNSVNDAYQVPPAQTMRIRNV
jgi:dynein regulatry complex protein 1